MPQLFPPYANTFTRLGLILVVVAVVGSGYVLGSVVRSPYGTRQGVPREQPVPFSHEHHAGDLRIDCRYCHTSVETSASAGYPSTQTCMGCHSYVWKDSPMLEPVRRSWRERRPIEWTRVYDLPDFVFFNHSIHVQKGVACETCHGRVDQMAAVYQATPLTMKWCLECHRNPERYLGARDDGFRKDLTECYVCHR